MVGTITSNVHSLNHVVDDVEMFGDLSTISAYEFENCLYTMKLLIKTCDKPLEQLSRRIIERSETIQPFSSATFAIPHPKTKERFVCTNNPELVAFSKIEYKPNTILSNDIKNCYILMKDNTIVRFEYAFIRNNKYFICGHPVNSKENFFTEPIVSSSINIFIAKIDGNNIHQLVYEITDVKAKLFCLPYKNQHVFLPLLHTL